VSQGEEVGATLIADEEEVAEALGDEEGDTAAFAFEERVRGPRGGDAELHRRKGGTGRCVRQDA
jgi:hypothetical protein